MKILFYDLIIENLSSMSSNSTLILTSNMIEKWKTISEPNYESYQISSFGRVANSKGEILKLALRKGYLYTNLSYKGKSKGCLVHRLVAKAFIPNDDNSKNQVNHKDGNKENNIEYNLEWVSASENAQHSVTVLKRKIVVIPITKYDMNGNFLIRYNSIKELSESDPNVVASYIGGMTKKQQYFTYKGFIWSRENFRMTEEFLLYPGEYARVVPGYENLYYITTFGRVYGIINKRFLTADIKKDYLCVNLSEKCFKIHTLVAMTFLIKPNTEGYWVVNHKDGNKHNNNVFNLEWITQKENCQHAVDNGFTKYVYKRIGVFKDNILVTVLANSKILNEKMQYSEDYVINNIAKREGNFYGYVLKYITEDFFSTK